MYLQLVKNSNLTLFKEAWYLLFLLRVELYGRLAWLNVKYRFIWWSLSKKIWKQLTNNFFFTWPDETNQACDGDLMMQSAVSHTWLMGPSRVWQANLTTKVSDKFFPKTLWLTSLQSIVFCLVLDAPWSFVVAVVQLLCFELNCT